MTTPVVWVCGPPSGGRAGMASPLAAAFRELGCLADDRSLTRFQKALPGTYPDEDAAYRDALKAFWAQLLAESPQLIVDLSPLPAALVTAIKARGITVAYWLLEDARDPAFSYWSEAAAISDLFYTYQADALPGVLNRYLPWGASDVSTAPIALNSEVLLHGNVTPHRARFLRDFLACMGSDCPAMTVAGPGWDAGVLPVVPGNRVLTQRTSVEETAALVRGRYVLIPLSRPVNAIPPRVWDSIAWGGLVLPESTPALENTLGDAVASWTTAEDAAAQLRGLLALADRGAARAHALRVRVQRDHLLRHRAQVILSDAGL